MQPKDRERIDRNVDQLVDLVDMEKLWPKIKDIIFYQNDPGIPKWENSLNDPDTKRNILLEVKTRGPYAYSNLINGLKATDQHPCVELLQNDSDESNADGSSSIIVKKSTRFYDLNSNENPIGTYRMRSNPRGLVLLISLINYAPANLYRAAAELDDKNLKDLFKQMGFKVQSERNLTAEQIRQTIKEFSQKAELQFVDSVFIIVCGHGNMNSIGDDSVVYGDDYHDGSNLVVSCNEIIDYFVPEKCEYLKNKPKVFIFQICRGGNEQSIVRNGMYRNIPFRFNLGIGKSHFDYSDMFIAHSTLPDCVAYRGCESGSWFIQFCCSVFAQYAYEHHVEDLFNLVDQKISEVSTTSKFTGPSNTTCQTPSLKNCVFKHCFINPGLFEASN
ncbi:caspase Dronc-like [Chelonus insularis]|uniref:caspase Dronc-like n=1 Tax=Chelonus insularis TaxID=460826 RepID=UPI00158845C2|nr:caspase Dronc-like [Chelonus insularis]